MLVPQSQDLTMFQFPLGTLQLTSIPMGYTNSMQIQHRDLIFLFQNKISDIAVSFVNDILVKGPPTHYENRPDSFETIPENLGICWFVWEHLQNINYILQCIQHTRDIF